MTPEQFDQLDTHLLWIRLTLSFLLIVFCVSKVYGDKR